MSERAAAVLREIATGGLAALLAGVVVGGIGGRIVMRLAALLVPDAVGRVTESGNRIGAVTLEGSLLLVLFGGVPAGVVAATIWVVARPWLPASRRGRFLASVPLGLAFGMPLLIEAGNPDFEILHHDPLVVASLVLLVGLAGPTTVVVDDWLARRLPKGGTGRRLPVALYGAIAGIGLLFTAGLTIPLMIQAAAPPVVIAIAGVGVATMVVWARRLGGDSRPVTMLNKVGRGLLILAVAIGLAAAAIEIVGAFGLA